MAETEMRVWGIHTKDELLFLRNNKIAIGWKEMGNLKDIPANRDDFKAKYVKPELFTETSKLSQSPA